jgi:predicted dehydrogenase/ribosomal protein S18 acetylase RimI-like enzyme
MARAAVSSGGTEIVAICEPDSAKHPQLREEFESARISSDYAALLRQTHPTVADIASPDHLHAEHATASLDAGCDVLLEKPLATTVRDARQVLELAEKHCSILVVNFTLRYQYPTREALRLVLDGDLGRPFLFEGFYVHDLWSHYSAESPHRTPWRTDPVHPQSVLLGGGCHPIDLILTSAGCEVTEVSACANNLGGSELPVDDCYVVNIKFDDGSLASVLVATGINGVLHTQGFFNVYGTEGTIINDTVYRRGKDPEKLGRMSPETSGGHNWVCSWQAFARAVEGLSPVPVLPHVAGANVAICEAARQSVESGRPVVPEIFVANDSVGKFEPAQLRMRYSKGLAGLRDWSPPTGFELCPYDARFDDEIQVLLGLAGFKDLTSERFQSSLMSQEEASDGSRLVLYKGRVVGAAFAGRFDATDGRIDYVVADPTLSGNGIGVGVCTGVTRYLLEKGYETVTLDTDAWRMPAIETYRKLGFEPVLFREDMKSRWDAVKGRHAKVWARTNVGTL